MRVFISAGEASGDAYGAALVREFKRWTVPPEDVTEGVFQLMREELGSLSPFSPDGSFRETWEVDSLEDVEFLLALEQKYRIKIPETEIMSWKTNRDVLQSVLPRLPRLKDGQTLSIEGIGGKKMLAEGVSLHADSSQWGAISITQAVRVAIKVFLKLQRAKKALRTGRPGLFIPIDFGFANIRMARYAKANGWQVLYFVPPGSWRRDRQGKDLPTVTDAIVTPFEWSAEILNRMGGNAYWFGHPIKQFIAESGTDDDPIATKETVALLPGSRRHELETILPLIAQTVKGLPNRLEFALAPSVDLEMVRKLWTSVAPERDDILTVGDTYGVLRRAKAGIICSGTATLEAALCRCPMVVVYAISPAMRREAKLLRMKRPKYISLPNIICDEEIVPEFAEAMGFDPTEVRRYLDRLIGDASVRDRQLADFEKLDALLGPSDAIAKTAEMALDMLEKSS